MSVIGRLDDQVDAVLIAPLKKGSGRKTGTPPQPPQQDAKENEIAESSSRAYGPTETGGGKASENEPPTARRDRLPVWLL